MLESHFNKVAALKACNFIKKRLQHRCFLVNIAKFIRTAFCMKHIRWLLLFLKDIHFQESKEKTTVLYRSSRPEGFCKKGVLRNFAKFTGEHLWESFFFNKVAGLFFLTKLQSIKKETLAQVFSREFCEISKNVFSYRTPLVAATVFNQTNIVDTIRNSFLLFILKL